MGRPPFSTKRAYEITHLWDNTKEILRRLTLGQKGVDIAKDLGCTPATVSNARNSEVGRDYLRRLHEGAELDVIDVQGRIREIAPKALARLEELMESKADGPLAAKISMDILDRAGLGAPTRVQSEHLHGHFTLDELNEIKKRAAEAGRSSGLVVAG